MNLIKKIIFSSILLLGQTLWAAPSPIPMLQKAANNIIATLKDNKAALKTNHQIIYQSVERYLLPNVDVVGMSRSVLGRQAWTKANAEERARFSKAFTALVIRTYANPLAEYTDEQVVFLPIRGSLDNRFIRVSSKIVRSHGNDIPLTYSLVSKNGQWKIYDLSVEGVSLLQSFRSQFAQALQNSNINGVISQMQQHSKAA